MKLVALVALVLAAFFGVEYWCARRAQRFRRRFFSEAGTMSGETFRRKVLPGDDPEKGRLVLGMRRVFSLVGDMPETMILPETKVTEVFVASGSAHTDICELLMAMEDQDWYAVIAEERVNQIPLPTDETTVAEFTRQVLDACDRDALADLVKNESAT